MLCRVSMERPLAKVRSTYGPLLVRTTSIEISNNLRRGFIFIVRYIVATLDFWVRYSMILCCDLENYLWIQAFYTRMANLDWEGTHTTYRYKLALNLPISMKLSSNLLLCSHQTTTH